MPTGFYFDSLKGKMSGSTYVEMAETGHNIKMDLQIVVWTVVD
jgi:hypothetical protein